MTAEQLQGDVVVGPGRFQEAEAVGRGPVDGRQVGVIGLVARIGGLAVLLGGEGVNQARLEAGLAEGVLDGTVILAGAFDGDDEVLEFVLLHGLTKAIEGSLEIALGVRQRGRFEEDAAIEVGQEVARARLGAVEGEDAEVFGADLLDAADELAVGLLQDQGLGGLATTSRTSTWHDCLLGGRGIMHPRPKRQRGEAKSFTFPCQPPYHSSRGSKSAGPSPGQADCKHLGLRPENHAFPTSALQNGGLTLRTTWLVRSQLDARAASGQGQKAPPNLE